MTAIAALIAGLKGYAGPPGCRKNKNNKKLNPF